MALVVDHPHRDLPGLVLVAWRLAQTEIDVFLVPLNLQDEIWHLAPDFVLLPYLRTNNESFVRFLLDAGIRAGVLDTEGIIFSPVPSTVRRGSSGGGEVSASGLYEYELTMSRETPIRSRVACYCAWSAAFSDHAIKGGWFGEDQIVLTGPPRIDFYHPHWIEAAISSSEYADTFTRPLVLFVGSFPLANPRFKTPQEEAKMMVDLFEYEPSFVAAWQSTQERALIGLTELAGQMASRFPKVTFIYRPHPFENENRCRSLLHERRNLVVSSQGTIDGWLVRASAIVHIGSSTAIDAAIADLPAFSPSWLPTHLPVPAVEAVSVFGASEEEISDRLNEVLNGTFRLPGDVEQAKDEIIEQSFFKRDGRAHERVADAISKVVADPSAVKIGECRRLARGWAGPNRSRRTAAVAIAKALLGQRLYAQVRELLPITGGVRSWDRSAKRFVADEVRPILEAIESVAGQHAKLGIRPVILRSLSSADLVEPRANARSLLISAAS